ncbi:unnamed protein product, partial [Symbiodinium sp. CCMP2456]
MEGAGCSLACVFLTNRASGLGKHAENPASPGRCWCHVLYGDMTADAYVSVVDVDHCQMTREQIEFKREDAKAMGQEFVMKTADQTEFDWNLEYGKAFRRAEKSCRKNLARAPWGCMWFEEWRKNVDKAVELNQTLHVFYFEDKVGKGKMAWHKLADAEAKKMARFDTGLGASQTAEVAYLDKMRCKY